MKKFIAVIIGGVIISSAISSKANAQFLDKGLAFVPVSNMAALATYANENKVADNAGAIPTKESLKAAKMNLRAAKANFKAAENFKKEFKDVPETIWIPGKETIVASFSKDEVTTKVVYDKKGSLLHTLQYFPASTTPEDIRSIVARSYSNNDILLAIKVQEDYTEFYFITIEDKTTYKQVVVYNGETEVLKEWKKTTK